MAKSRAQRKAERRAREEAGREALRRRQGGRVPRPARHPGPGLRRHRRDRGGRGGDRRRRPRGQPRDPRRAEGRPRREAGRSEGRQRKQRSARRSEQKRKEREQLAKKQKQAQADRQRGGVLGFFASCWAELKKVQWPDRDTLVQATAVTIIFVTVAAAYLGALDALFNLLVKQIL